jgi:hypothetical protein
MVYNFIKTIQGAQREEPEYRNALNLGWKEETAAC